MCKVRVSYIYLILFPIQEEALGIEECMEIGPYSINYKKTRNRE